MDEEGAVEILDRALIRDRRLISLALALRGLVFSEEPWELLVWNLRRCLLANVYCYNFDPTIQDHLELRVKHAALEGPQATSLSTSQAMLCLSGLMNPETDGSFTVSQLRTFTKALRILGNDQPDGWYQTVLSLESVVVDEIQAIAEYGAEFEEEFWNHSIWPTSGANPFLDSKIDGFVEHLEGADGTDFWARWYIGLLEGNPVDWNIQLAIALVTNQVWDEGPEAVAQSIREIEARHLSQSLSETIVLAPTGLLSLVPQPFKETKQLGQLLDIVRDNLELATGDMSNGLTETSFISQKIQRALTRYGNDPQRLEMEFEDTKVAIASEIAEDVIPSSSANRALLQSVSDTAGSIRESDPEIAANRERLTRIRLAEISEEDGQRIADVAVEVAEISEGVLQEDLLEDRFYFPGVRRDDNVPSPIVPLGGAERNAALEAQAAQLRVASRLAKIWSLAVEHDKPIGVVGSIASILGTLIALVTVLTAK